MSEVVIQHTSDEGFVVICDGQELYGANYDEHGWSGMTAIQEGTILLARALGIEVVQRFDEYVEE